MRDQHDHSVLNNAIMRFAYEEYCAGRLVVRLDKMMADPVIASYGENAVVERLAELRASWITLHHLRIGADGGALGTGPDPGFVLTHDGIDRQSAS